MSFLTALLTGGAADEMNVPRKPQALLLSDSDEDECQMYQPPTSKLVNVSVDVWVVLFVMD